MIKDTTVTASQINAAILSGVVDGDIGDIQHAIKSRKDYLKQSMMRRLRVGDTVLVDNIRPKAICGLTAIVNKVNRTTINVSFGADAGKYSGPCKIPASCCKKV